MPDFKKRFQEFLSPTPTTIIDRIPIKRIENDGVVVDKNDHYQQFLRVKTYDLFSMSASNLNQIQMKFTNLLRMYAENMKIISLSYPTKTLQQQNYYAQLVKHYTDELKNATDRDFAIELENRRERAIEQFNLMQWIEKNMRDSAFFIVVYGDNHHALEENVRVISLLGQQLLGIQPIKEQKEVEYLLARLNNMNTTNE